MTAFSVWKHRCTGPSGVTNSSADISKQASAESLQLHPAPQTIRCPFLASAFSLAFVGFFCNDTSTHDSFIASSATAIEDAVASGVEGFFDHHDPFNQHCEARSCRRPSRSLTQHRRGRTPFPAHLPLRSTPDPSLRRSPDVTRILLLLENSPGGFWQKKVCSLWVWYSLGALLRKGGPLFCRLIFSA